MIGNRLEGPVNACVHPSNQSPAANKKDTTSLDIMKTQEQLEGSELTSSLATACFWNPSSVKGNRWAGRGTRASKSDTSSSSVTAHLAPPLLLFAADPPPPVGLPADRAKEPFVEEDIDVARDGCLHGTR